MKKYAQILNGKANLIVIEDDKVDELRANGITIIDITGIFPQPQTGWLYDFETNIFTEPPIIPVEPDTTISNVAFWDRFIQEEKETLLDSVNKKVKVFLYEVRLQTVLDLNNQKLINAVNTLESAGLVAPGRAAIILTI